MASKLKDKPLWHPLLWPTWIIVFILFCLSLLPMTTKQKLGAKIGRLAYRKMRSRRRVTEKNIAACFPDLSPTERDELVEAAFVATGRGFLESIHAWWCDLDPYIRNLKITGVENLEEAKRRGKGVLLIGGHYSIFDFALPLIASLLDKPGYVYRPNDNPVIEYMIERGRRRHFGISPFTKYQLKQMAEHIEKGGAVWYACDQDFGRKSTLFVPFFGVDAGCITMPSHIARTTGATVMCVSHIRHPDGQYEIGFSPVLDNFGEDEAADAKAWNDYLETWIRKYPDQYLWMHKRFKTRPEGASSIY